MRETDRYSEQTVPTVEALGGNHVVLTYPPRVGAEAVHRVIVGSEPMFTDDEIQQDQES